MEEYTDIMIVLDLLLKRIRALRDAAEQYREDAEAWRRMAGAATRGGADDATN